MFYLIKCCNLRIKKRTELKSGTWFRPLSYYSVSAVPGSPAVEGSVEGQGTNWTGFEISCGCQETFSSLSSNLQSPFRSLPPQPPAATMLPPVSAFGGCAATLIFESWLKDWEIQERLASLLWKHFVSFLSVPDSFSLPLQYFYYFLLYSIFFPSSVAVLKLLIRNYRNNLKNWWREVPKTTELYTWNEWIVQHGSYISTKLFLKREKKQR